MNVSAILLKHCMLRREKYAYLSPTATLFLSVDQRRQGRRQELTEGVFLLFFPPPPSRPLLPPFPSPFPGIPTPSLPFTHPEGVF